MKVSELIELLNECKAGADVRGYISGEEIGGNLTLLDEDKEGVALIFDHDEKMFGKICECSEE